MWETCADSIKYVAMNMSLARDGVADECSSDNGYAYDFYVSGSPLSGANVSKSIAKDGRLVPLLASPSGIIRL